MYMGHWVIVSPRLQLFNFQRSVQSRINSDIRLYVAASRNIQTYTDLHVYHCLLQAIRRN